MNLHHLRYFCVLAQTEHYGRAARQLGITQPSLSHAMAALEEELGLPLLEKQGRGVRLSRYGQQFYQSASETLARLDAGVRRLQATRQGGGTLRLGAVRGLAVTAAPQLMRSFRQQPEGREVEFCLNSASILSSEVMQGLDAGKYDFVFSFHPGNPDTTEALPFAFGKFVFIVPEDHPLAGQTSICLKDTRSIPQVFFSQQNSLRDTVEKMFARAGGLPPITMETESDQVVAGLVAEGFGAAVVPQLQVLESLPVKVLQITDQPTERMAWMVWRRDAWRSPAAKAFEQHVRTQVQKGAITI